MLLPLWNRTDADAVAFPLLKGLGAVTGTERRSALPLHL